MHASFKRGEWFLMSTPELSASRRSNVVNCYFVNTLPQVIAGKGQGQCLNDGKVGLYQDCSHIITFSIVVTLLLSPV